jgi:hypothetical protein
MDEKLLRQVREAIRTGKFPARDPHSVTGHVVSGSRSDADCALCGMRLNSREAELELEFSPDHGCATSTAYRVHPQCYAAWQLERDFSFPDAKGSRGSSGNVEWLRYARK